MVQQVFMEKTIEAKIQEIIDGKYKPVSFRYMGNKNKLLATIMKVVNDKVGLKGKVFYDLFGGSGAISFGVSSLGVDVIYNELEYYLFQLVGYAINHNAAPDWAWEYYDKQKAFEICNENNLRNIEDSTKAAYLKYAYSFRGEYNENFRYAYREDQDRERKANFEARVNGLKIPYPKIPEAAYNFSKRWDIMCKTDPKLKPISSSNKSYEEVPYNENSSNIFYCDLPDKGVFEADSFNVDKFINWGRDVALYSDQTQYVFVHTIRPLTKLYPNTFELLWQKEKEKNNDQILLFKT